MAPFEVPRMRFPVFVSAPSPDNLNDEQQKSAEIIFGLIKRYKLEWRALGRSDYPQALPLREVVRMVRHCSGGIILGFEQVHVTSGTLKRGSGRKRVVTAKKPLLFPTPWNQIEAGILYAADLPLLILRESGVTGGVFDIGATEVYIHDMPKGDIPDQSKDDLDSVFQNWAANVRRHYYAD